MKIIIFGAGISGLTVAHELIEKGFDVEIYEKNSIAGGMARSFRNKDNIPTEHSWRGYGPFYHNTFEIMKRIPLVEKMSNTVRNQYNIETVRNHNKPTDIWTIYRGNIYDISHFVSKHPGGKSTIIMAAGKDIEKVWKENGYEFHINNRYVISQLTKNKVGKLIENLYKKSVYDNLNKKRLAFKFLYNERKERGDVKLSSIDFIFLIFLFGRVIFSNNRKKEYFKIRLDPILKDNLSEEGYHFISDFLAGPGYGFDKNTMSLGHYAIFVEYSLYEKETKWQVMSKPTSEAWIDPWVEYLKNKGVKFYFNSELKKINYNNNSIKSCIINTDNKEKIINGDDYILSINPFNLSDILEESKIDFYKKLKKSNIVNNQISFRLGFNKKINFDVDNGGYIFIDSPYNITFYPQEDHWEDTTLGNNGEIKTLISGTIIQPFNNGSLTKKSALNLTIEELKDEIIHQMFESKDFMIFLKKSKVSKENIIFKEIFNDWIVKNNRLVTKNKKWVNNFINEEFRLENHTKFKNLYISGSHCKTSIYIWSMEGAVESGKNTSNIILDKYKKEKCYQYKHQSHPIVKFLSKIDDYLYSINLSNFTVEIIFIFICFIVYRLINQIYKKILKKNINNFNKINY